ncbi:chaplin [Streptomyces spiralis]
MRIRMTAAAVLAGAALVSGAGTAVADDGASATGTASTSPGLISGNVIQVPVDLDLNLCGTTVDVIGVLNPAAGNACANK